MQQGTLQCCAFVLIETQEPEAEAKSMLDIFYHNLVGWKEGRGHRVEVLA